MKIGIITKIGKNYGAVLQAYALKKKLCDLGADAHIIKYTPDISEKSYKVCKFPWRLRGTIANLKSLFHFSEHRKSTERFLNFRDEHYDFIGKYDNDEQIEAHPPKCDLYITGSDQVWNPLLSFDRAFYCGFADKYPTAKTASYAASIGLKQIPQKFESEFKARVEKLDYITVRERQATSILQQMGIHAKIAPDPTLLLSDEEWGAISSEVAETPYILCYFVSFPTGIEKIVKRFKEKLGIRVINLMTSEQSATVGDVKVRDAGPSEFLGLFKKASFVITSSFHGTIFSVINKKPFVTTLYNQTSSRVTDLLSDLGLTNRIIDSSLENVDLYCDGNIYTDEIEEKLMKLRKDGIEILNEISGVN